MDPTKQNNPVHNPQACREVDEFFGKINRWPFRSLGDELDEAGPDAIIVALGASAATRQDESAPS